MAQQPFYVPMSPVVPGDAVTQRALTQVDSQGGSTTFLLDPSAVQYTGTVDDTLVPYTFTLVDTNAVGDSTPSAAVTLGPPTPPPPPPPPGIPTTPTLGTPVWGTPPAGKKVVDLRR